jgi:hypothetical protein
MSFFDSLVQTPIYQAQSMAKQYSQNPEQALLGMNTPGKEEKRQRGRSLKTKDLEKFIHGIFGVLRHSQFRRQPWNTSPLIPIVIQRQRMIPLMILPTFLQKQTPFVLHMKSGKRKTVSRN